MEILCPVNVHTCVRDEHCQYSFQVELQVGSSQSHGPSPVALESRGQEAMVSLQLCQRENGGVVLVLGVVPCSSL